MTLKRWTAFLGLVAACSGCSSKASNDGTLEFTASGGAKGDSGALGTGNVGGSILPTGSGGASGAGANGGGTGGFETCAATPFAQEAMPVDIYIMFDKSDSMSDLIPGSGLRWWDAAVSAVTQFVQNPGPGDLRVGIQYFPLGGIAPASCDINQYQTPAVEITAVPANAQQLVDSINKQAPGQFTPTSAALQGALNHITTWSQQTANAGRASAVVFVTDGFPTECDPQDVFEIAKLAKAAFESPQKIRTFVVGFDSGLGLENLNQIAEAGGTGKAFLIKGGDVGAQFIEAMNSIASRPMQCQFNLPPPPDGQQVIDINLVQVTYTPAATAQTTEVPKISSLGSCQLNGNNGWFYDSPTDPKQILVCPGTCDKFSAGVVKIAYGCAPTGGIN